jgi:hypothetical protein
MYCFFMSTRKYAPVHENKINLIKSLLSDPVVSEAYYQWVSIEAIEKNFKKRQSAFVNYYTLRDQFLGLPPLSVYGVVSARHEK